MLHIYIVDDEIMAVDYFRVLLRECKVPGILDGYSTNSYTAYDEIIEKRPEVVFIDVNMPGMSGIELMKQLKNNGLTAKIILLTAYRDFDFIKKGMDLGIESYMLKNDLTAESLNEVLESIQKKLDAEKEIAQMKINHELRKYLIETGNRTEPGVCLKDGEQIFMIYVSAKRSFSMQRIREDRYEVDPKDMIQRMDAKKIDLWAFLNIKDNIWTALFRVNASDDCDRIASEFQNEFHALQIPCILCLSEPTDSLESMRGNFRYISKFDARRLYFGEKNRISMEDLEMIPEEEPYLLKYETELKKALWEKSREREHEALANLLRAYSAHTNDESYIRYMQMIFYDYCAHMIRNGYMEGIPLEWVVKEFCSISAFNQWLTRWITEFHQKSSAGYRIGYSDKITMALNYIEKDYADSGLSIQMIAESIPVSEGHLRKIFKEEMGVSVSEYLLQYRVEKAKELLNQGKRTTDIFQKVGFSSSQYFCTVFKKKTGYSPKEYVKHQQ